MLLLFVKNETLSFCDWTFVYYVDTSLNLKCLLKNNKKKPSLDFFFSIGDTTHAMTRLSRFYITPQSFCRSSRWPVQCCICFCNTTAVVTSVGGWKSNCFNFSQHCCVLEPSTGKYCRLHRTSPSLSFTPGAIFISGQNDSWFALCCLSYRSKCCFCFHRLAVMIFFL